ncbi:hypothetical protein ABPG75_007584 [Micractinium tetrahymenae]
MSQDLCAELRNLQALLAAGSAGPPAAALPPPPHPADDSSSSSDDDQPLASMKKIKAGNTATCTQKAAQTTELERQLAALRQQLAEEGDRSRRLEAALEAARQDGALVGGRLHAELAAKQEESAQLAELVLALREEADGLHKQLHCATSAAQQSGQSAQASLAQLQAAAAEWRRQGEDSLEALAEERERSAALTAEVHRLRALADALQAQLAEERRARMAAAEAAAAAGGPAAMADLRARLAQERAWRKAVCRWLEGEMATRADLERALVNAGTAARTGAECGSCTSWGAAPPAVAPPMPPRRLAASQLAPVRTQAQHGQAQAQAPASPTVHVTVHSPPGGHKMMVGVDVNGGADGAGSFGEHQRERGTWGSSSSSSREAKAGRPRSSAGGRSSRNSGSSGRESAGSVATPGSAVNSSGSKGDWREHFKATMQAFDERHNRLQQELSTLRREALMQAA